HFPSMCPRMDEKVKEVRVTKGTILENATLVNRSGTKSAGRTQLQTIHTFIKGQHGTGDIRVRVLFDAGSSGSDVTEVRAKKTKCVAIGVQDLRNTTFGGMVSEVKRRKLYNVTLQSIDVKFEMNVPPFGRACSLRGHPGYPIRSLVQAICEEENL